MGESSVTPMLPRIGRLTASDGTWPGRQRTTPREPDAASRPVPLRALTLSLVALTTAVASALICPQELLNQETLAAGLALIPALLLAHYRGWPIVSTLLGGGLVALSALNLAPLYLGRSFSAPLLTLFMTVPYIAIALGAGWFGEVRRYQAALRATQLQLIQSEKLDSIGSMAAGVAHEVKNPLMMILTGVRLLSRRSSNTDAVTERLLRDMTDAVQRADHIIGGLLNYSRNRDLDLTLADLNGIVEKSLLLVMHELNKGQITLTKDLNGALPPLTVDEFKIQQVFVNLLNNAIQAAGRHGDIRVRTSLERLPRGGNIGSLKTEKYARGERVAVVRIDDSGPGIAEDNLTRIFDPFFTTKPPGSGTGLGLSVSRQIVEMHGGILAVVNRAEGGARATVIFKLQERSVAHGEAKNPPRR